MPYAALKNALGCGSCRAPLAASHRRTPASSCSAVCVPRLGTSRPVLDHIAERRERPAGRVRLVVSPLAAAMVLAPKLGAFARAYPDVVLDVTTTNEMRLDLVAGHFDAGIHLGEFIERDMIAVRVSADQRAAIVGAPAYFAAHPKPKSPRDLTKHRCLNFRHGADETYRWEFDKGKQSLAVAVEGPLVVDDVQLLIRAAVDGVGLTFLMEEQAAPYLASGALVRVLEDWCEPFAGYFLLSEPAAAARGAVGADRDTATGRCSP